MKIITSFVGKGRYRWSWGIILQRFGLLIFVLMVMVPLIVLITELISSQGGNSEWLTLAIPTGRRLGLFLNSLGFAAAVATAGVVIGTLGGSILWRWDTGWRAHLRWFVLALAPIPPYIHALAWTSSTYNFNTMLQALGLPNIPTQGWLVCGWIQLMSLIPIAVGLALVGLKSIEPLMIDAARTMRSDFDSLLNIILPLAAPVILAGGGILFLLTLIDYSVPSLLNLNVYALELFAEYSASNEPVRVLILSLPLLLIAGVFVLTSLSPLRNAAQSPAWGVPTWKVTPVWPKWLVGLQCLTGVVLVAQIAVPILSLTTAINTWHDMVSSILSAGSEITSTFLIATLVAVLCIPLSFAVACELVNPDKQGRLIWMLVIAPLAVPPPLIGVGLIAVWNHPLFFEIYGTIMMPVLVGLTRFTSLAVIVLVAQLRRIDPLLIDAARMLQTSHWQIWKCIWLPMLAPGLLAATGIVFSLTTGELGATLLVAPPGQATLTMRIYNFLHYGASDTVAGLCLMMVIITLVAGAIAVMALVGWSNLFPKITLRRK